MRGAPLAGLLLLLCAAAPGQTDSASPDPAPPTDSGKTTGTREPTPAPNDAKSDREFKPTEEVSPDQEVDFPADL